MTSFFRVSTLLVFVSKPPPPLGSSRQNGGLFFPTNCLTDKEDVCSSFKQLGEERPGMKASLLFYVDARDPVHAGSRTVCLCWYTICVSDVVIMLCLPR